VKVVAFVEEAIILGRGCPGEGETWKKGLSFEGKKPLGPPQGKKKGGEKGAF